MKKTPKAIIEVHGFKKVNDCDVITLWKPTCKCEDSKNGQEMNPCYFAECGVPICQECGDEMEYVETQVRK